MANQQESVEEIFGAALERSPKERASFLNRACAGDDRLREHVEDLLHAHESAGDFLENPMALFAAEGLDASAIIAAAANDSHDSLPPPILARFAPGQLIGGRFTVVRFIAHGGMGEVYEVDDQLLQGAHVALKAILPHIAADAALSQRFQQEVLLARKVTHPNLCPIYDIARCQDTQPPFVFLTMKLLSGQTLADRIRAPEPIPLSEVAAIFRQMTAGIAAIHSANVVHGDIKPNNVMLDGTAADVRLSIMDFGLARLHEAGHTLLTRGPIAGTLGYLAPEILRGGQPTQATDLYALGVLLHKLLTGETPDAIHSNDSTALSPALAAADVPPALIGFVRQLLADDPAIRQRAFAEMQAYFGQISLTSAMPFTLSLANPPRRPLLTRRTFALGSALTVCATAAAGIAWNRDLLDDVLHPLPRKRFVSLIGWPPTKDAKLKPMLMSLIEAIGNELTRAEAFDHDLYVVPYVSAAEITTPEQINQIREAAGTNLVLAASGITTGDNVHMKLSVMDSNRTLREKRLQLSAEQQVSMRARTVRAAAHILDVQRFQFDTKRLESGTANADALAAYQAADHLMAQPNDVGLNGAIENYKHAVDLDSRFAKAYAKLSLAYFRSYILHREPGALLLAKANADTSLTIDETLVEGHLALASVLDWSGDRLAAIQETGRAIAIDPANPRALVINAQTLQRCNRWREAEVVYKRAVRARPNYWFAHQELGTLYNDQGNYKDALIEFQAASMDTPAHTISLSNIAGVLLQQGKLEEASVYAKKSLAVLKTPEALATMAEIDRCAKSADAGVSFAREACELASSDALNWLQLADCLSSNRKNETAAMNADKQFLRVQTAAVESDPGDGPGWMLLALAKAKNSLSRESEALIAKAENSYSGAIEAQLYKLRTLALLSRTDDAFSTMRACLRRGATEFQFRTMPDLDSLRADKRYRSIIT